MIAVDTNVLVRLLIDDPQSRSQVVAAKLLLRENAPVFVAQIVQVEAVWVLESGYEFDKQAILRVLDHIKRSRLFVLQHETQFQAAVTVFAGSNADFSDCLILEIARKSGHLPLGTFDRALGKLDGAERLQS